MRRVIATGAAVAALLVAGGATELASPALACGDTPGFCPNPPDNSTSAPATPNRQYHTPNSGIKYE